MGKTKGEGRSEAEKAGRLLVSADERKRRKARREAEDLEWAERSGPVVSRFKEPLCLSCGDHPNVDCSCKGNW